MKKRFKMAFKAFFGFGTDKESGRGMKIECSHVIAIFRDIVALVLAPLSVGPDKIRL